MTEQNIPSRSTKKSVASFLLFVIIFGGAWYFIGNHSKKKSDPSANSSSSRFPDTESDTTAAFQYTPEKFREDSLGVDSFVRKLKTVYSRIPSLSTLEKESKQRHSSLGTDNQAVNFMLVDHSILQFIANSSTDYPKDHFLWLYNLTYRFNDFVTGWRRDEMLIRPFRFVHSMYPYLIVLKEKRRKMPGDIVADIAFTPGVYDGYAIIYDWSDLKQIAVVRLITSNNKEINFKNYIGENEDEHYRKAVNEDFFSQFEITLCDSLHSVLGVNAQCTLNEDALAY